MLSDLNGLEEEFDIILYRYTVDCNILGAPRFESCGVVNSTEKDRRKSESEDKASRTTAMVFNFLHMQFYRSP